ncbi:YcxB family protein [Intestinimonas timonensis]|uniref:YcxB family protein n=1 Tax=Intestinimonas timonensis TaxID=1689270 RepID=UPI001030169B|nr:YcxB family protein [Intestinimonas timonensis]
MELRYNLTQQDFQRGILLHEKRLKKPLDVIRKVEWFFFLALALFGAVMLVMLTVVLAAGRWEEDFGTVLGLSVVTLVGSLAFLWVLSARRRAFHGVRLMAGEDGFFGPRTLTLTKDGVAETFGVGRRVESYDAISEVWEKKGYVLLYLKSGVWEVVPPCAFTGEGEREAFLSCLAEARQGRSPQTANAETSAPAAPEEAVFTLHYAWTPETLMPALLRANLAFLRTRLFWRPAAVLVAILSVPMLVSGVLTLIGTLTAVPPAQLSEIISAIGILVIGLALCSIWLNFVPDFMAWAIRRQAKKDAFHKLLEGPITDTIGPGGVDSLRSGERERTLWSQIGGVKSEDWGLVLFRRDRKMLLFPASAFADRDEQEQAAEYARGQTR